MRFQTSSVLPIGQGEQLQLLRIEIQDTFINVVCVLEEEEKILFYSYKFFLNFFPF